MSTGHSEGHSAGSNETGLLGLRWFFGGGIVAIIFSMFLVWSDNYLTNSKREEVIYKTMNEIRDAQTSLPSRVTDARQISSIPAQKLDQQSHLNSDHHVAEEHQAGLDH